MASGERTPCEVESDEEFEEMTSDELREFYFGDFDSDIVGFMLTIQLAKRRLDRVNKILEMLFADPSLDRFSRSFQLEVLDNILEEAFEQMPVRECSQLLQIIFRYGRDVFPVNAQRFAVKKAVFYQDNDSLDTLREFLGNSFVNQVVANEQERLCSRSELLSVSLRSVVQRFFASFTPAGFEILTSLKDDDLDPIKAAAELGHTDVVERLIAFGHFSDDGIWSIACRRRNLAMVESLLSKMDITRLLSADVAMDCLLDCVLSSTDFFRRVLSLMKARLGEAGLKIMPRWLNIILDDAIFCHRREIVAILLGVIDQDRSVVNDYRLDMETVLRARSAAILRDVLIQCPEVICNNPDWDPLLAIQAFHWPVGARLLVEAGVKIKGKVPLKFVGLLSLSLKDRCRIAVRRHLKLPLSQNVDRLPLPGVVKRGLLYR